MMKSFPCSNLAVVAVLFDVFPDGRPFHWVRFFPFKELGV